MIGSRIAICKGTKVVDGSPCPERANGTGYCHKHDQSAEAMERRLRASQKAGLASAKVRRNGANRVQTLPPVKLRTLDDAVDLREQTVNELRAEQIDQQKARLLLQACRDHVQQIEMCDLEERVALLNEVLQEHGLQGREFWRLLEHLADLRDIRKERRE